MNAKSVSSVARNLSLRHIARSNQAVASYAPEVWQRVSPRLVRWVRETLREVKPQLESLVIESRTQTPDELYLQGLLEAYRFGDLPLEPLAPIVSALTTDVLLEYGWLPSEPRTQTLRQETEDLIRGDLSAFWRTRTDPALLARRIVQLRQEGLSVEAMSSVLSAQYRGDFFSAERLIRTTYTSGANRAHVADLEEQGYTHLKWLTARDARVRSGGRSRANHRRMEGVTVPLGEAFVTPLGSRLRWPGDRSLGAPIADVVNCRCTTIGINR